MTVDILRSHFDVSRETLERLEIFASTLTKWNPKINLVSKRSLEELWTRHILDSVQVFKAAEAESGKWLDIGSGGGLPGVIVAILALENGTFSEVRLMESDQRKCAFLRNVARECGVPMTVVSERIEMAEPEQSSVLSARALADLSDLLGFTERHLSAGGIAIFPKGISWKKEVNNALKQWRFDWEAIKSLTEPEAVILKIKGVERV